MSDSADDGGEDGALTTVSDFSRGVEPGSYQQFSESASGPATVESIFGELYVQHPDLVLSDTLSETTDVELEFDYVANGGNAAEYLFFTAHGEEFDRFDEALMNDHTVTDPLVIATGERHRIYRVVVLTTVSIRGLLAELGARLLTGESDGRGWVIRVQLPERKILSELRAYCDEHDITFRVTKLYQGDHEPGTCLALSDYQRETLELALDSGYYDVPRGISQAQLAERVGVSPSAISQRLRRATRDLLEEFLR